MPRMTDRALPVADRQRQRNHLVIAARTGLGAGKPMVDFDQILALLLGLVLQHSNQRTPARFCDMLRQFPVLQHVFHFQCLDYHRLVFVNELSGQAVLEISTGIRKTLMRRPW